MNTNTRLRRHIRRLSQKPSEGKATATVTSAEKFILGHAQYPIIRESLIEGVPLSEIARWFAQEQLITINEKTFLDYLRIFRRNRGASLLGQGSDDSIDGIVAAHKPNIDVLSELNRLARIQKIRLSIDVKLERSMGKLFNTTGKEIEQYREILSLISRLEGGHGGSSGTPIDDAARSSIREMQTDEESRDRMHYLLGNLFDSVRGNESKKLETS